MAAQMTNDRMLLPIPPGMIGYGEKDLSEDLDTELFLDSDVYIFQRPLEKIYPGVIMKLKHAQKKVVVELDDHMHGLAPMGPKAALSKMKKRSSTEALALCVRMADMVTVSTQALKEEYEKYNSNVVVLPNYLRTQDFAGIPPSWTQDREKVRVGWMGLMDYRANDLSLLKPWLLKFLKRHPEVVFVNVGSKQALDYLCVPKDRRMDFPAAVFPAHFAPTSAIDIGLVPLTKNRFNECKSNLKGMEYGAVGACVIASDLPEYKDWIYDGGNGFLVNSRNSFESNLEDALTADLWRDLAENNWHKANEHTIEAHWKEWLEVYGLSVPNAVELVA